ncbi:MAG: cytochrome d ubiquinol oxidase subunit II [Pseudomonadota bacterium]
MAVLQVTWFVLIGLLLTGYAVLDGFDLGVGFWHLFAKKDVDRRVFLAAIGPVWDGNEVWLLVAGGALFAAFPPVYATTFSGLYLALILVLAGLIFRAVSIEFRNQVDNSRWRSAWDVAFGVGSIIPGLLFGVAMGNILRGFPLDESGNFAGTFLGLLNPYSLMVGVTGLSMFATHGAVYLMLKTEDELRKQVRLWAFWAWGAYFVSFAFVTIWSLVAYPALVSNFVRMPISFLVPLLAFVAIVIIPIAVWRDGAMEAFLASAISIVGLMAIVGLGIFPNLVPSLGDATRSLSIQNASSSYKALLVMLVIALVGMPLVLGYTIFVFRTFKGKVRLSKEAY